MSVLVVVVGFYDGNPSLVMGGNNWEPRGGYIWGGRWTRLVASWCLWMAVIGLFYFV